MKWRLFRWLALGYVFCGGCYPFAEVDVSIPNHLDKDLALFEVPEHESPKVVHSSFEARERVVATFPPDPRLPGRRKSLTVHLTYPRDEGAALIIVVPTLGGTYKLSRMIEERLLDQGYGTLRMERRGSLVERSAGLAGAKQALRGAVIDVRRSLDWALAQDGLQTDRIGITGISAGGILASLVCAIDERISASVLMLAGGHLAEMTSSTVGIGLARLRDACLESRPELLPQFEQHVSRMLASVDPLAYADRVKPESVVMINAAFDDIVPRRCYRALWEKMGRPELYEVPAGHFTAFVFLPVVFNIIDEHFERWLQ